MKNAIRIAETLRKFFLQIFVDNLQKFGGQLASRNQVSTCQHAKSGV